MERSAQGMVGLLNVAARRGWVSDLLVIVACLGVWAFLSLAFLVDVTAPLSKFAAAAETLPPERPNAVLAGLSGRGLTPGENALSAGLDIAPLIGSWPSAPSEPCATAAPLSR